MDQLRLHSDSEILQESKIQSYRAQFKDEALDELPRTEKASPHDKVHPDMFSPAGQGRRTQRGVEGFNMNRGHWLHEENLRYHWFLEIHYQHFINRQMRRMDKIFKSMEHFVGTRQAEQCRSHHQKMEKKYFTFPAIVANLRKKHYGSLDQNPMIEAMKASQVDFGQGIATAEQLEHESKTFKAPSIHHRKKGHHYRKRVQIEQPRFGNKQTQQGLQAEVHEGNDQHEGEQGGQNGHNAHRLLEQSNLHMGQLMLYHQKQDISCLFNNHNDHHEPSQ